MNGGSDCSASAIDKDRYNRSDLNGKEISKSLDNFRYEKVIRRCANGPLFAQINELVGEVSEGGSTEYLLSIILDV